MDIKDILLFLRTSDPCAAEIAVAAGIACRFGARVSGVGLVSEPIFPVVEKYEAKMTPGDVLEALDRELCGQATPVEATFRRSISAPASAGGWSVADPHETLRALLRALLADLVIIGQPEPDDHKAQSLTASLIISSGSPCLIVPETTSSEAAFERILVVWDGSRPAKRALHDGLAFLTRASAVEILMANEDPSTPTGELASEALLQHLSRHGVHGEVRREPCADPGGSLLNRCEAFGADLVLMGAYGHSRIAETLFGGGTRWAMSETAIPVVISH